MVLEMNSSLRKNQRMSLWRIFAVSGGYLAKLTWACTALYHSSMLLLPCLKLVKRSNLAPTSFDCGLQKSSNLPQIISSVSWSVGKPQETYWSMPKSPDQAITFLHCYLSGNAASSHSSIFLHLRCHFKNLWYSPSLTVQSILGPSIYGMNVPDGNCGSLHGLSVTSGSCSWSELDSSSWLLSISSSWVDTVASTWAELFIALGILDLY